MSLSLLYYVYLYPNHWTYMTENMHGGQLNTKNGYRLGNRPSRSSHSPKVAVGLRLFCRHSFGYNRYFHYAGITDQKLGTLEQVFVIPLVCHNIFWRYLTRFPLYHEKNHFWQVLSFFFLRLLLDPKCDFWF